MRIAQIRKQDPGDPHARIAVRAAAVGGAWADVRADLRLPLQRPGAAGRAARGIDAAMPANLTVALQCRGDFLDTLAAAAEAAGAASSSGGRWGSSACCAAARREPGVERGEPLVGAASPPQEATVVDRREGERLRARRGSPWTLSRAQACPGLSGGAFASRVGRRRPLAGPPSTARSYRRSSAGQPFRRGSIGGEEWVNR